jgi:hypothetical protein
MLSWSDISEKVETVLTESQSTFLGTPIGVDPRLATKLAVEVVREQVEEHLATIPRVPTNKYDAMVTISFVGLIAGTMAGFGFLMYKLDKNEFPEPIREKEST